MATSDDSPKTQNTPYSNKGNGGSANGGNKGDGDKKDEDRFKREGKIQKDEAEKIAKELGYQKTNRKSHGETIYQHTKKRSVITRDTDSHSGGAWKEAKTADDLTPTRRNGTFNKDLTERIGK
ncbi:hypothetical protein BBW65_05635 [Helicobacter enhydrae]|uniref:Novel toxin 21 domain-containing protein n=1 Tax=Helicobacter enhydrae TaxID=222136 RepID=A0A1B1U6D7_9HELI|nr:toxin C-terminal domain-containing protein [Helicobacter enhydrae]ANV98310.1 hypothetical protein BBW65_05635 [Helicobacter enhydrae]